MFVLIVCSGQDCMTDKEHNHLECFPLNENFRHEVVNTSKCDLFRKVSLSTNSIYYLSTKEGLCSHMLQYNIIWNWAVAVNRSVVAFDFESPQHFGNISISVCDVFTLPKSFQCMSPLSHNRFIAKLDCVFVGKARDPGIVKSHDFLQSAPVCKDVNILNVQCFAGTMYAFNRSSPIYPSVTQDLFQNYTFREHYNTLFTHIIKRLELTEENTIVFHWRRGDQLRTRCHSGRDKGVNCKPVKHLIEIVNSTCSKYGVSNFTKYVATNEQNSTVIGKH